MAHTYCNSQLNYGNTYLDKIRLKVIDHPNKMDVYIDEAFTPPPFPSFKTYGVIEKYIPTKATDSQGNDLIKSKRGDNIYVSNLYNLYQVLLNFMILFLSLKILIVTIHFSFFTRLVISNRCEYQC